ncbi:hydroxysqualene dehydroxylase HpnE [Massilia sp. PAMC28688]|uniref:hydroxysqualene dehydroxylase HpnE n=1 Tax=Massilia sp. PAMC28688 TaxID=2861283 RepID=UPI001C632F9D|nr:hydroxysqualene dehydroxylase HpnE [Massilia sp. PAMC28688]QYF93182.1 hydroxysqualene dehydroxylase HpnE [Massilia sp. PAMC28688]
MAEARRSAVVVGAGWAGCSAAVELAHAGYRVTLLEAARTLGGRARAVQIQGRSLDNGQHILLGAYKETLRLMRKVGIDPARALLRLPLQMRYPAHSGGMDFLAPRLPAPLHLAIALLRTTGLSGADKMSLARFSTTARWMDWRLHHDCSVSELLERFDQTARLTALMWRPLCLAALNTPPERASAQVFLNVLRDSLGARRADSDMLLPRTDLTDLFPIEAAAFVGARGGCVRTGAKVSAVTREAGHWRVEATGNAGEGSFGTEADAVVLAGGAIATAPLLARLGREELAEQLSAFSYEPITTCYLHYPSGTALPLPFYALVDRPDLGHWGQFVFDRGHLDAGQSGVLAVVISASSAAASLERAALGAAIAGQLAAVFASPALAAPDWTQVITEKRATFACTPGLARPANDSGLSALAIAGDYTAGDYPATLEGAVRSGVAAAQLVKR